MKVYLAEDLRNLDKEKPKLKFVFLNGASSFGDSKLVGYLLK